jgi:signal transduction histidine kinase/HAMP domain-containing protein
MKRLSFSGLRVRLILLVLLAVIPSLGLILYAASVPDEHNMAPSLVWLIIVLLLTLAGAWWGGNWLIVRQLKKLMEATEQLGTGDLAARVSVSSGKGELHQLARAFNRMAQGLQQRDVETKLVQDELQRLLRQSTALREINLAVTSTLNLRGVLGVLMEKIEILLPYAVALVWLRDGETGEWERTACWNIDEADWKQRKVKGTPPIIKIAIESRAPVSALDVTTDPRTQNPEFYRRHGLVSYLAVPLIVKGEALGVLAFLTRERHEFTGEEIEFLSTLAGQAAMAIHNSQLHEQSERQAVELEKANKDLSRKEAIQALLKELSQDIASQDVGALLKKLTDKVCEFFKVDIADVRIIENGVPRILGVSGIDEEKMQLGRTGSGRGASGWIIKNRRPLVIPDITKVDNPPIGRTTRRIGIHGYLAAPFLSRSGEVLAVLRALTYQPRDFLQEEIELLQQMTNGAAIALENARLLEQTQTQAAELRQANKVKNEFLGFVSHELRTPVNVIMGYAALLQNKMLGEINPEQDNALEKMSVNSKGLLNMIEQLLEATKIEAGAAVAQIAEVNLSDFIEELRTAYTVPLKKPIRLDWNCPGSLPVIKTDGEKLRHILLNVIDNAVKYTQQGGVTVSARVQEGERAPPKRLADQPPPQCTAGPPQEDLVETGDKENGGESLSPHAFVEFEIADTGIGIPKDELPRIFEMFSQVRGGRTKSAAGVGLGLHIVKKFTELLGGDIRVTSEEGKGSTFTITIPTGADEHRPGDNQDLRTEGSPDARASADIDPPFPPSET